MHSLLFALALTAGQSGAPTAIEAFGGVLFTVDNPLLAEAAPDERSNALRSALLDLESDALASLARGDHEFGATFELPLFDGDLLELRPRSLRATGPDSFVVASDVAGRPDSYVVLASEQGTVAGKVWLAGGGAYELRARRDGFTQLDLIDPHHGGRCQQRSGSSWAGPPHNHGRPRVAPPHTETHGAEPESAAAGGGLKRFDLLMVYTPLAAQVSGGTLGMRARLQVAVEEGNLIFEDSGVFSRLELVSMAEVDYDEGPGNLESHLDKLTDSEDGPMDVIHIMRNAIGADCVALITGEPESDGGGVAWVLEEGIQGLFFPGPFSVTIEDELPSFTLIHELGHNFGCIHDPDNNPGFFGLNVPPYAIGYRFTGDDGNEYRTVMAYAPGERIPRMSNPDVLFQGQPTGEPDFGVPGFEGADNRRRINETDEEVEDFKSPVPKLSTTYVDFQAGSWGNGSSSQPYRTLQLAYVKALPGSEIVLRGAPVESIGGLPLPYTFRADSGPVELEP